MQSWNLKGIDVINAHERQPAVSRAAVRAALACAGARGLDVASLHTHAWPLEFAAQAFAAAEHRPAGFVKAVVYP
jgi:hypothetical protein